MVTKNGLSLLWRIVNLYQNVTFFLPKFPLLVFGRYFNNSGFVNDPCSSLTFFHNTDNPRWVTLLFFNILKFIQVILSKSNNLLYIIKSCNYLGYLSNQRKLCLNFRFKLFQNLIIFFFIIWWFLHSFCLVLKYIWKISLLIKKC